MDKKDYMRLPKERLAELLEQRDKADEVNRELMGRVMPSSIVVAPYTPPCYASDGMCINPQMDCVNCPKRGLTGGHWSTDTGCTQ
jgi:hypothetical protein